MTSDDGMDFEVVPNQAQKLQDAELGIKKLKLAVLNMRAEINVLEDVAEGRRAKILELRNEVIARDIKICDLQVALKPFAQFDSDWLANEGLVLLARNGTTVTIGDFKGAAEALKE